MVQFRKGRASPWMVQVRDTSGDLLTRSFLKKEDAEEFEHFEKRKRQLRRQGLEGPREEILLLDYAKGFIRKRQASMPWSTVSQDQSRLKNYWLEKYGLTPLQSMTTAEIKTHLDYIQFELGHSPADRNRHRALLHKLFQEAMMDEKVIFNPVSRIPLVEEVKRRNSGALAPEHQEIYISGLYQHGRHYGMLGDLMLWTGARIMSAAATQYRDIDFQNGVVRIRRLYERATKKVVERTKGEGVSGEEMVPLFPVLRDKILSHRETSAFTRPGDFIACREDGRPVSYEGFLGIHNAVVEALKIPVFTPHALRKAFATNAKRAGYTRTEIQEMLGHSSEQMTRRYDLKDIEHLVEKGKRLGFGASSADEIASKGKRVSALSARKSRQRRTGGQQ